MLRYLLQLESDIWHSIESAPAMEGVGAMAELVEDESPECLNGTGRYKLPDLFGIPFEAFPPSQFLSDTQINELVQNLEKLWKKWGLDWVMPPGLSSVMQYDAMLHAMKNETVEWHFPIGGTVTICHYESNSYCPFGEDGGYCHCKSMNETARQDLEIWEDYVRSQGIDPYENLSQEAEQAFQAENQRRAAKKLHEDDWANLLQVDEFGESASPFASPSNEGWNDLFYNDFESLDSSDGNATLPHMDEADDALNDFFEDGFLEITD